MKTLKGIEIKKGTEITFKDHNNEVHLATVTELKEKTFISEYLEVTKYDNVIKCKDMKIEFRYSGKKIHYRYLHSDVLEVMPELKF
jgi:hypothetical protein